MKPTLIAAVFAGVLAASSAFASTDPCTLCGLEITEVREHHETVRVGKLEHRRVRGAVLRVTPKPGLTAAWLHHALAQGNAELAPDGACPLPLATESVSVRERGAGFEIRLVAKDTESARELLARAHNLVKR